MKEAFAPEALSIDKERDVLKDLVVNLQQTKDSQAEEYEQLCYDLLNCIFLLQNSEKQTMTEQQKTQQNQL